MTRRLRIASYYETRLGRNDGNPLYVTNVLKRDYPDVEYVRLAPDAATPVHLYGTFDLNLWVDWGEDGLGGVLPYTPMACPRPNAYWVSDTHLGWDYRVQKAKEFDWVFAAQQHHVAPLARALRHDGGLLRWLPHAVEPQAYNPGAIYAPSTAVALAQSAVRRQKVHDLVFVGYLTFPQRVAFLDQVFRAIPNSWYATRFFEGAADLYTQAKVVLNHAVNGDLNMRVFEALATRSCLLTPDVPGLLELFEDRAHLVTYTDADDAIKKAQWLIEDEDARERIAEAGYREVLAHHTVAHRVRTILETTGVLPAKEP